MYQLKAYAFWDALTQHRTDGALVRLITPVYESEKPEDAEVANGLEKEQLTFAVAFPALVAIPEIVTPRDIRRRKVRNGLLVGTALGAIGIGVVLFQFYVMDLDVIWARRMRKLML